MTGSPCIFIENYFIENSNNNKKIWAGINEVISLNNKNRESPYCIEKNNDIITDPKIICNEFNDYFSNIAEKILQSEKHPVIKTFEKYLNEPLGNSFVYESCSPAEVLLLINQLNPNKASGPNGIHTKILQLISKPISIPLSKLFNISILNGTHPEKLKLANIIPIFKKGSRLKVSNYRPISLLSNLNKIFEKIMFKRISSFIEKYDILFDLQFGFRSKHSTSHALISITEKIRSALDNGNIACGIFIDLQKAFDTVNHDILIKKLYHYGFRGPINNWLRSYLTGRKQNVLINGFSSSDQPIKHGVPQGSVLGPILFLLYINDLNLCIKHSSTYHFADDTNLLNINNNYKSLQKELNKDLKSLVSWLSANKISLNKEKTEIIFFRKNNDNFPSDVKIKLNGKRLIPSKQIKYLGVYLDEHLSGVAHCEELTKKLNRAIGLLAKARHYVPLNNLINIYYAAFSSHMSYGCQIWTQKHTQIINKISNIQKKAVRIISFADKREHSEPLFKRLKILKFKDLLNQLNCTFVHDFLKGDLPQPFVNTFRRVEDVHSRRTKNSLNGKLFIPRYSSISYGKKSILISCISSWNHLSTELHNFCLASINKNNISPDLSKLSRQVLRTLIKEYFLHSYTEKNETYIEGRYYVSHISLTGMQLKLKRSKAPYYHPFNIKLKIKKISGDNLKYKIIRKN